FRTVNRSTTAPGLAASSAAASVPVRLCRCGTRLARDRTGPLCSPCESAQWQRYAAPPQVPAEFWSHPPLAEALKARHMGKAMRAYRQHPWHGTAPLPQSVLGEWLQVTQAQISRIETGPAQRHLDWLMFVARHLHIPGDLLWFELISEKPHPAPAPTDAVPGPPAPTTSTALPVGEEGAVVWDDVIEARRAAGRALAGWRGRARLTQHELAARVGWARSTVANVEVGLDSARRGFWHSCDEATGAGGALLAAADAAADLADRYRDEQHAAIVGAHAALVPHHAGDGNSPAGPGRADLGVGAAQARDGWPAVQVVVSAGATVTIEVGDRTGAGGVPVRVVVAAGPAEAADTDPAAGARVYSLAERRGRR
ncbi:helix-turn-helix transcriptional regulator, partial [Dactylosporangium sp. NPDC051485]|uniref:helix-turn-helix transcriptional regulator n=1 Tax=Dactylosporangium sp. NPDC051485 TaxID=3154846 RepID=UPI003447A8B0